MTKLVLIAGCAGQMAAATLEIRVYDWAKTPGPVIEEAEAVAARIFRTAGIELRWIPEAPDSPEAKKVILVHPPPPAKLRQVECAARRDIGLLILLSGFAPKPGVLGYAEPLAPAGINVNVYLARVADIAADHGLRVGVLLGHVIAHEIGHVLLRTPAHSKNGLMAGGWDGSQLRTIRSSGLFFDKAHTRRIRATLVGEGCDIP